MYANKTYSDHNSNITIMFLKLMQISKLSSHCEEIVAVQSSQ